MDSVRSRIIEDDYVQDKRIGAAIDKMYRDYRKDLFETLNKEELDMNTMKKMISTGHCGFKDLRKFVNDSYSQSNNNLKSSQEPKASSSQSIESLENLNQRNVIIGKIENIVEEILSDIANDRSPKLILRNQRLWSNCLFEEKILLKPQNESQVSVVKFNNKNSKGKFGLILHLLSIIHRMMLTKTTCTKRELYYQNISKVQSQRKLNTAINAICCLLNTPQWELGLLSTSKGLIAGPLDIVTHEGHSINCLNAGGVSVPHNVVGIKSLKSTAKFILVVEKDTIFQKLLDEGVLLRLKPCILLTGKGYPDINTRLMLKLLVDVLKIPSLALVDGDPHGIEIMCTYKFGSLALAHLGDKLVVPSLKWLGIHPSDISKFGSPSLTLSQIDKNKCNALLCRPYCTEGSELHRQIKILLEEDNKTETEGIGTLSQAYLTDIYIPHKICAGDFI